MSSTTQPHYLATILLIVQREQERLNAIIPKLASRELSLDQLRELRSEWPSSLSMIDIHRGIIDGLDNMIHEYEKRRVYPNREAARSDVFDYIEMFYNPTRRHGTSGGLSPVEYERRYIQSLTGV